MAEQPVILVVDDDMVGLTITEQELRKRYGRDYRVLGRQSAAAALDELRRLKDAGQPVALILADQHMPEMDGTDFLGAARGIDPVAKRVMLVSWGDRSAPEAILTGCAVGQIEFFITKPWHTAPDERFHREVAGFLYEWSRLQRPVYEAVRVVGEPWAPRSHELRDVLGRNGVAFGFYDAATAEGREVLREAGLEDAPRLPVAVVFGGRVLEDPTNREVAEALGVRSKPSSEECDLLIVGAGPAGLAAAVYGSSEGLETVVLEREALGGQAGMSTMIHNYLGLPRRHLRRRAHLPRLRAGLAVRGRVPVLQRGQVARTRHRRLRRRSRRRLLAARPLRHPRHGRDVPAPRRARLDAYPRVRRLLRLRLVRGEVAAGHGGVRRRRRQLGRAGGHPPGQVRPPRDAGHARRRPHRLDVALPRLVSRERRSRLDAAAHDRRGRRRRHAAAAADAGGPGERRDGRPSPPTPCSS